MSPLLAEFIGALLRWLLTALGASLVARNVITPEQAARFAEGFSGQLVAALALLLPLAWSLWHKWWSRLRLRAARELPAYADDASLRDRMRDLMLRAEDA